MTLQNLILYIAIGAVILTVLIGLLKKGHKSWVATFLQNFTGILFIVSGLVKAVDPLGTAYKMEQYFTEFEYTFRETSARSEEHTSELQSLAYLVCRLLLEKKK